MVALAQMRAIVVLLLAISLAIFPVAMPHATVSGSHHGASAVHEHEHRAGNTSAACENEASFEELPMASVCNGQFGTSDRAAASCCGTVACHAFQVSAAPMLYVPFARPLARALPEEQQVTGLFSGRLERPPRTV